MRRLIRLLLTHVVRHHEASRSIGTCAILFPLEFARVVEAQVLSARVTSSWKLSFLREDVAILS